MVAFLDSRDAHARANDAADHLGGDVQESHAPALRTSHGPIEPGTASNAHPSVHHRAKFAGSPERAQETPEHPSAPYQQHSGTSKAAAQDIAPHLGRLQSEVLAAYKAAGPAGLTDAELKTKGFAENTLRPRRIELLAKGLIASANITRETPSKRRAVVWVAKEFAPSASAGMVSAEPGRPRVAPCAPGVTVPGTGQTQEPGQMSLDEWWREAGE